MHVHRGRNAGDAERYDAYALARSNNEYRGNDQRTTRTQRATASDASSGVSVCAWIDASDLHALVPVVRRTTRPRNGTAVRRGFLRERFLRTRRVVPRGFGPRRDAVPRQRRADAPTLRAASATALACDDAVHPAMENRSRRRQFKSRASVRGKPLIERDNGEETK